METLTLSRRRFLQAALAAGCAATIPGLAHAYSPEKVKTNARIVILGGGSAGITLANQFNNALDGAKITVIDPRKDHWYWPGFTLVGAGIKPASYVQLGDISQFISSDTARSIEWLHTKAKEIDPEARKIHTEDNGIVEYDYLVLALGLSYDYNAIEGMNTDLIGKDGIASIYLNPEAAQSSWQALSQFVDKGGKGVFTRPVTEMRCAGAPLKYTLLTEDRLTRSGQRGNAEIAYYAPQKALFSVPIVSERVRMIFEQRGIATHYEQKLVSIDPGKKSAVFEKVVSPPPPAPAAPSPTAPNAATPTPAPEAPKPERTEVAYDFIHVVPPMNAPEIVRNSPLVWQVDEKVAYSKAWAKEGWAEVDKATLRHKRYPTVFAVGDIAGVPKGKTAASVKWQAPVAVHQLVAEIAGREATETYNGYTSCPLITRLGNAMLIEFDYKDNLYQSFPNIISPLDESWASWVMKTMALKPTYVTMLQGKA